jgi:translation initiation factor eIF-2B subunit epsilon
MAVKKAGKASDLAEEESEVPLQAVLLADSFAQKFRPITLERPKVCMDCPHSNRRIEVWITDAG